MSTDITIESRAAPLVDFDDFVLDDLAPVASALAMIIDDASEAARAVTTGVRSAHHGWNRVGRGNEPQQHVFGVAVATHLDNLPESGRDPTLHLAVAVACHGIDWPIQTIAKVLRLSRDDVARHLAAAEQGFVPTDATPASNFRSQLRDTLANTPAPVIDIEQIKTARDQEKARRRIVGFAAAGATAVVLLLAVGQFISRPERVSIEQAEPIAMATPATIGATPEPAGPNDTTAASGAIGNEPRPDLVPIPELIAADGDGGFVGVRSPSAQNPLTIFTRSTDARTWELASRWNLGSNASINRFERSGAHFVAWIDGVDRSSESVIGTVGISEDLIAWTVLELAIGDPAPYGLIYQPVITDLSVSGNNVLALVSTTVEIDFAALLLSESYTCGQTITRDKVSVNLCNSELDVLSLSDVERLPARNRLFVSRAGRSFVPTDPPFSEQTAAHLTTVNGAFAVTDETGVRFATSVDADTWQTVTAGKPPFPVRAAATNLTNDLVGVGELDSGELVVFHNTGAVTNNIPLVDLVGDLDAAAGMVAASGPTRWVVYVFEPQRRAWILTSVDGLAWDVLQTSPPGDGTPRLLVGDNEVLVQWINDGQAVIQGVSIP